MAFFKPRHPHVGAQTPTAEEISAQKAGLKILHEEWKKELSAYQTDGERAHLPKAGNAICSAIRKTHGEEAESGALQAGGWPGAWQKSFAARPPRGELSDHDQILFQCLKDIGMGMGEWDRLPQTNMQTVMNRILEFRNRSNSPFCDFGGLPGSGLWPYDAPSD